MKTLLYYITTSLFAILVGLLIVNMVSPGIVDGETAKQLIGLSENTDAVVAKVEGKGTGDLVGIFLRMVPTNVVAAAADGQMLGLIFFSLLFGFFMTKIENVYAEKMYNFWQGIFQVMMKITDWVMKFAPIGVFGLIAKVVADTGFSAFVPLACFFFSVLAALAIHFFVVLPMLLFFVGRVKPLRHYRAMAPALLTTFSTSSFAATLPFTMECVAATFIGQPYGIELGFVQQFIIVLMALVTSMGVCDPIGQSGRHRHHPCRDRLADTGDRSDSGGRSRAGYVPHPGECVQRLMRRSDHCAGDRGKGRARRVGIARE